MAVTGASQMRDSVGAGPSVGEVPLMDFERPVGVSSRLLSFDRHGHRLDIDLGAWEARVNGQDIGLSPVRFRLVVLLAQHAGTVVTLDQIHTAIWGHWFGSKDNVSVHIHHIREALGPCASILVTRRGLGYMLRGTPVSDVGPSTVHGSLAFLDDLQRDATHRHVVWFVTDRSRLISWVSDTITALTGWPVETVVGRTPCSFIREDEREAFRALFPLEGGRLEVENEAHFLRADGRAVPAWFSGRVITDARGDRLMGVREMRIPAPLRSVREGEERPSASPAAETPRQQTSGIL